MSLFFIAIRRSNVTANQDGNGRVTRALVSVILARFGLLPLLVTVEDKDEYFRALMAVGSPYVYIYITLMDRCKG
jgi:hypothetical protein